MASRPWETPLSVNEDAIQEHIKGLSLYLIKQCLLEKDVGKFLTILAGRYLVGS